MKKPALYRNGLRVALAAALCAVAISPLFAAKKQKLGEQGDDTDGLSLNQKNQIRQFRARLRLAQPANVATIASITAMFFISSTPTQPLVTAPAAPSLISKVILLLSRSAAAT